MRIKEARRERREREREREREKGNQPHLDTGATLRDSRIGPRDDVSIRSHLAIRTDRRQELERVESQKLPNDGEDKLLVAIDDVNTTNAYERKTELLADHDRIVSILDLLKLVLRVEVDLSPVDAAGLDVVHDLEQNNAVAEVLKQIVDIEVLDAEGINPHAKDSLWSGGKKRVSLENRQ